PPAAIFVLVLGLRDDVWNGSPLPIDLSPFGMTGCSQLVATDASLVFTADPAGRADVALAI
ncbi:MAG: hypothetical protein KDE27_30825, partial [Planctomycetes bacterium]|nr:hypothetical protein [Planctomycetota bacterium]